MHVGGLSDATGSAGRRFIALAGSRNLVPARTA